MWSSLFGAQGARGMPLKFCDVSNRKKKNRKESQILVSAKNACRDRTPSPKPPRPRLRFVTGLAAHAHLISWPDHHNIATWSPAGHAVLAFHEKQDDVKASERRLCMCTLRFVHERITFLAMKLQNGIRIPVASWSVSRLSSKFGRRTSSSVSSCRLSSLRRPAGRHGQRRERHLPSVSLVCLLATQRSGVSAQRRGVRAGIMHRQGIAGMSNVRCWQDRQGSCRDLVQAVSPGFLPGTRSAAHSLCQQRRRSASYHATQNGFGWARERRCAFICCHEGSSVLSTPPGTEISLRWLQRHHLRRLQHSRWSPKPWQHPLRPRRSRRQEDSRHSEGRHSRQWCHLQTWTCPTLCGWRVGRADQALGRSTWRGSPDWRSGCADGRGSYSADGAGSDRYARLPLQGARPAARRA